MKLKDKEKWDLIHNYCLTQDANDASIIKKYVPFEIKAKDGIVLIAGHLEFLSG